MVEAVMSAAEALREAGCSPTIVNARFVKPMDLGALSDVAAQFDLIVTIEENAVEGGFGAAVASHLADRIRPGQKIVNLGIPDRFVDHGPRKDLLDEVGLSPEAITRTLLRHLQGRLERT